MWLTWERRGAALGRDTLGRQPASPCQPGSQAAFQAKLPALQPARLLVTSFSGINIPRERFDPENQQFLMANCSSEEF